MNSLEEYMRIGPMVSDDRVRLMFHAEKPISWFFEPNINMGFHHLSTVELQLDEMKLIGLGHKFIPSSYGPSKAELKRALRQFNRRVLIRDFFWQLNRNADDVGQAPDTMLRTANPNWHPLDARIGDAPFVPTPSVQEFLDEFGVVMLDKQND